MLRIAEREERTVPLFGRNQRVRQGCNWLVSATQYARRKRTPTILRDFHHQRKDCASEAPLAIYPAERELGGWIGVA
jgi:hypothetical protein